MKGINIYVLFYNFLEEDQLKEQAKDFEKMKNMMEVFSSEHIKGSDLILFVFIQENTTFNLCSALWKNYTG